MAQCLPSKHEDKNPMNQNQVRTLAGVSTAVTLDLGRPKQEELTEQPGYHRGKFQASEKLCVQKQGGWLPNVCACTGMCAHTHLHTHTFIHKYAYTPTHIHIYALRRTLIHAHTHI